MIDRPVDPNEKPYDEIVPGYVTFDEFAKVVGVHRASVRRWVLGGALRVETVAVPVTLIPVAELFRFMDPHARALAGTRKPRAYQTRDLDRVAIAKIASQRTSRRKHALSPDDVSS